MKRVSWIDVAKFWGIFFIYLGHFGDAAGKSYPFVFQFHVPLFFFISGCMENFNSEKNIGKYMYKKFKHIIIPFWLFSFISIVIRVIIDNSGLSDIKDMIIKVAQGAIRNKFFNGSIWFLTCLFVMAVLFQIIKLLKNRAVIGGVCIVMFMIAEYVIKPRPISEPHWIYNIDSAFYYIIYYSIGYVVFPVITNLFKMDAVWKKIVVGVSGILAFLYSGMLFEGTDLWMMLINVPIINIILPILRAMTVIWLVLIISYLSRDIDIFNDIGRNTLYLCGSEYIVRVLIEYLLAIVGVTVSINSPLSAYLYGGVLIYVANRWIVPIEKKMLHILEHC